jgi:hypothetical protein
MGVHLQGGNSVHMIDAFFDAVCEGHGLVRSGDDDDDFPCVHDGADADGQSHFGDLVDVVVEEARVSDDGIVGLLSVFISPMRSYESLDACAGGQATSRFIEGNVSVGANA